MKKDINGISNLSYITYDDEDKAGIKNIKRLDDNQIDNQIDSIPPKTPDDIQKRDEVMQRDLTSEEKTEKRRILKNIFVISFAFFFLFTSYNSTSNLQSSLNKTTGTAALTGLYVAYIISCCLLPSWVLQLLKEKKTMVICMLCFSGYMIAQFYPTIYTLLPTAIFIGLGAAPLWSAKCTYLTKVGTRYGFLVGERSDVIVTRFFGIFFLFFQATQIVGNLISSLVLSVGLEPTEKSPDEMDLSKCGYNFCIAQVTEVVGINETLESISEGPPLWQIYTMAGIYLSCALLSALIILLFLDPLESFPQAQTKDENQSTLQLLTATFNQMRHPYQILMIPLTIWSGMEQAFLSADFTAAYVSCGVGVHMVGYVMIFYGVCDAICSLGFSPLVKKMGRVPLFTMAFIINIAVIVTLMRWRPHPDEYIWFFVFSGLWGVADAVWQTQINSLYGVIFPGKSESAFSNYRLWESLGFFVAYMCSTILCIDNKINILFGLVVPGMVCYYVVEFMEMKGMLKKYADGTVVPIDKLLVQS